MIKQKKSRFKIDIIYRILIFIAFCLVVVITANIGGRPYKGTLQEGDIATETVHAPFTFTVKGDIDQPTTDRLRQEAEEKVPDIYVLNEKINADILSKTDEFFSKINKIRNIKEINDEQQIELLTKAYPNIDKNNLEPFLKENDTEKPADITKEVLSSYLNEGIINSEEKARLIDSRKIKITLNNTAGEKTVDVESLKDIDEYKKAAEKDLKEKIKNKSIIPAITEFIESMSLSNISYDEQQTLSRRQKARKNIGPAYNEITIFKDEIIVAKNQRVTKEHITYLRELLNRLEEEQKQSNKFFFIAGLSIISIILILLCVIYFILHRDKFYRDLKNIILIGLLSTFIIIISRFIVLSFAPSYLIPLASVSMCIAILIDYETAVIVTVILSLFIGILTGNKLSTAIVSMVGGLVGIYGVKQVRRRSQILSAGLLVGIANFACITAIGLLQNLNYLVLLKDSLWGVGNGILSSFIVMGILPILEYSFKITTDINLLELSDLNHPILKEMVLSAPGTYHHSLIVGNLAEAAADAIGANSLLARVASYYHDIGKIKNADYFAENKIESKDRHGKLQPKMSNLIITSHVKEGVDLAKKYKLSPPIVDIIKQHHGTSLTFYFYQRALEKQDESNVKEEEFRYPGPRPQTKEAAIVLLADSVEAASRTIQEPTAVKIEKLVHRIINNKFIDGQLDDCSLTLKDLHRISDSFTRILVGIYHSRIDYPQVEQEEEINLQEPFKRESGQKQNPQEDKEN